MTQRVVQATLHRHAGRFTFGFFTTNSPFDIRNINVLRQRCATNSGARFGDVEFGLYEDPDQPAIQRFGIFPTQERIETAAFELLLRNRILRGVTLSTSWVKLTELEPRFLAIATARLIKLQAGGA
jgi:hypothetical protein